MSRSRKQPWGPVCVTRTGEMKAWKKQINRQLRRELKDPESEWGEGKSYKRFVETWDSPADGKTYYGDWPKGTRK